MKPKIASMQAGPAWPLVIYEEEFDQFTSDMLSTTIAPGNPVEVFFHWIFTVTGKWKPVFPDDPNSQRCCTGEITKLSVCGDGDICIYIKPSEKCGTDCTELLAPKQTELVCELPWSRRDPHTEILPKLKKGDCVEICGYPVIDGGHGGHHELHDIVTIDPYV